MKTALCLHGLAGGKNDRGVPVDWNKIVYSLYKTHILDTNDVDVFLHTWTVDLKDELTRLYNPRKSVFEKQIMFDQEPTKKHSVYSRWYSLKKTVELKREYEKKHHFTYDCVMITRFDLAFFKDVRFEEFDMNYFYVSNWEVRPSIGVNDLWFFSNSDFIDTFSTLYDHLDSYLISYELSNHVLAKHHLEKQGLFHKAKRVFYGHQDFALARDKYRLFSLAKAVLRKAVIGLFSEHFFTFLYDKVKR